MKWKTSVQQFLNNEQLLLDIKSALVLIVSIGLPMLYFLYSKEFSLGGLFNFAFGVLSLFVIFGNVMTFLEISEMAERNERESNVVIQEEEKRTREKQATLPKNVDDLITFNKLYNEREQENKNRILTNKVISKLTNKITQCKIKNKPYAKYEEQVAQLEKTPLLDKTYKPVKLKYIITQAEKKESQITGNDAIYINPKTYGFGRFMIKQPLKSLSIGSSGMFILAVSDSGWTIFLFYVVYILSLALLVFFRYPSVRKVMKELYVETLINKQRYIDEFHEWKAKEKAVE